MPPPQPGTQRRSVAVSSSSATSRTYTGPRAGAGGSGSISGVATFPSSRTGNATMTTTRSAAVAAVNPNNTPLPSRHQCSVTMNRDGVPVGNGGGDDGQQRHGEMSAITNVSRDIDDINGVNYEFFGAGGYEGGTAHLETANEENTAEEEEDNNTQTTTRHRRINPNLDERFVAMLKAQSSAYRQHFRFGHLAPNGENVPSPPPLRQRAARPPFYNENDDDDFVSDADFHRHFTYERLTAMNEAEEEEKRRRVKQRLMRREKGFTSDSDASEEASWRRRRWAELGIVPQRIHPNCFSSLPCEENDACCCICLEGLSMSPSCRAMEEKVDDDNRLGVEQSDVTVMPTVVVDVMVVCLPRCGHAFHEPCLGAWFDGHSTCPLCRTNVL